MVQVTQDLLQAYVGGQIEISELPLPGQVLAESEVYRGEIVSAVVSGDEIHFTMGWAAVNTVPPSSWKKHDQLKHDVALRIFAVSDIGPGSEGGNRLLLESTILREMIVLYPPDGSRLDPSRVEGLDLPGAPPAKQDS